MNVRWHERGFPAYSQVLFPEQLVPCFSPLYRPLCTTATSYFTHLQHLLGVFASNSYPLAALFATCYS